MTWTVEVDGHDVRDLSDVVSIRDVTGLCEPRPPRGSDYVLPGSRDAVEASGMMPALSSAAIVVVVRVADPDDMPAALLAFHSWACGGDIAANPVVTLAHDGYSARARWSGGGKDLQAATVAYATAQWSVLSDWTAGS